MRALASSASPWFSAICTCTRELVSSVCIAARACASFSDFSSYPLTVALNNLVNSSTGVKEYNVHFAGAFIAALPTLVVYLLSGKYFVRGLMAGSVKG